MNDFIKLLIVVAFIVLLPFIMLLGTLWFPAYLIAKTSDWIIEHNVD